MSDTVALVAVERVVRSIQREIAVDDNLVKHTADREKISPEQARNMILASSAKRALSITKGNERVAIIALVIVNGRPNRLPQCVKLLRKHEEGTVRAAYEIKGELAVADTSLRSLCMLVEMTDEDIEGEAGRLRDLLEQIAIKASSEDQEWFFHNLIKERLAEGHLLEVIEDEVMRRVSCPWYPPTHSGVDNDS